MEPVFNFGGSAMLSVLAFLGTAGVLAAAAVGFAVLALTGRWRAARWVGAGAVGTAGAYLVVLTGVSLTSGARAVDLGGEKYFCELDCHLAYSVVESRRAPTLSESTPAREGRVWEVVAVRVRFDEQTVSPRRGNAPLRPNPREIRLVDAAGRSYAPSEAGMRELERAAGGTIPLDRPLRPGEAYTTALVFDLPADAGRTELVVTERDPVTRLLIGHENSLFHRPTAFRLAEGRSL